MDKQRQAFKVKVYAADHGYGDMKTSENVIFPTDVVPSIQNVYGSPKEPLDRIIYSDEHGEFFVGNFARMAIESNPNIVSLDAKLNRYYFRQREYLVAMLSSIAASYPEQDTIQIKVFVTGLPSKYWEDDNEELAGILQGIHKFTLTMGETTRDMVVKVDSAFVIPQPYGTLCFFGYDENGVERDPALFDDYVGVLDFGFYTTDVQLTLRGTTVPGKLESLVNPLETISRTYIAIQDRVFRLIGKKIPVQVMQKQIDKGTVIYYESGKQKKFDLREIAEEEFTRTANNVREKVLVLWSQYDLENIIITGGGASIEQLVAPFRETFGENLRLPKDEDVDSVLTNVLGYKRFGMNVYNYSENTQEETGSAKAE